MLHQFTTGEYRYIPYASADDKKHPNGGGGGGGAKGAACHGTKARWFIRLGFLPWPVITAVVEGCAPAKMGRDHNTSRTHEH